jgi:hypothetical protein
MVDCSIMCYRLHWRSSLKLDSGVDKHQWGRYSETGDQTVNSSTISIANRFGWSTIACELDSDYLQHTSLNKALGQQEWHGIASPLSDKAIDTISARLVVIEENSDISHPHNGLVSMTIFVSLSTHLSSEPGAILELVVNLDPETARVIIGKSLRENLTRSTCDLFSDSCPDRWGAIQLLIRCCRSEFINILTTSSLEMVTNNMTAESRLQEDRVHLMVSCLQELQNPTGRLVPVIRSVEMLVSSLQNIRSVHISCKLTSDGSILYDTHSNTSLTSGQSKGEGSSFEGTPNSAHHNNQYSSGFDDGSSLRIESLRASWGASPIAPHLHSTTERPISRGELLSPTDVSYEFEFNVYEVQGVVVIHSQKSLGEEDKNIFSVLVQAMGRRVYELHRGKRNKKALAGALRDSELQR